MSERLTLPVKETRRVSEWQVPHVKATRRVSKDMQYHCITVNCSQINPTIKPANQARQANTTRERVVSPARQGNPPHKQRTCSITADQLVSTHTCHITKAIHAFNRSSDTHPCSRSGLPGSRLYPAKRWIIVKSLAPIMS